MRREPPRRASLAARAARAYVGAEPETPGEAGAREKKHGLALVRESLAAELEWARGAGGGGGGILITTNGFYKENARC